MIILIIIKGKTFFPKLFIFRSVFLKSLLILESSVTFFLGIVGIVSFSIFVK